MNVKENSIDSIDLTKFYNFRWVINVNVNAITVIKMDEERLNAFWKNYYEQRAKEFCGKGHIFKNEVCVNCHATQGDSQAVR